MPAPRSSVEVGALHTERIAVRFADAQQLSSILLEIFQPDASQGSVRPIDAQGNDLLITGTDDGIARVRAILRPPCTSEADSGERVAVVYLAHAEAASVLKRVAPDVSPPTRVVADTATNAIVVSGTPEAIERVRRRVAELDYSVTR